MPHPARRRVVLKAVMEAMLWWVMSVKGMLGIVAEGAVLLMWAIEVRRVRRRRWKLERRGCGFFERIWCFREAKRGGRGVALVLDRLGKTEEMSPVAFGGWGVGLAEGVARRRFVIC